VVLITLTKTLLVSQLAPLGEQLCDDDHKCDHEQRVHEIATYVEVETEQPEDDEYYDDSPKHISLCYFLVDLTSPQPRA
jgi:hypothetical protein